MKNNILKNILLLNLIFLGLISCTTGIPAVKNAQYSTYNLGTEKGYKVNFEVSHDSIPPSSVVINRIRQNVTPENKNGLKYSVTVLAQSTRIVGFRPTVTDRANGIFFKTDTADVFKPVEFKLKN